MSIDDFDPLNQDERLLASKLGLSKRDFAPSASVEEAIRREARLAEQRVSNSTRPAFGWMKYGGIAAACVLAFGIAWKTMRTPHPTEIDAMRGSVPTESERSAPVTDSQEVTPSAVEAASVDTSMAEPEAPAAIAIDAYKPPVAVSKPKRQTPAIEPEDTSEVAAPPAPNLQTAMESAAAAAAEKQAAQAASKQSTLPALSSPRIDVQDSARRADEAAAQVVAAPTAAAPAPAASNASGVIENGYDARPPKTTDAQDVQQAWLKRIRALSLDGKQEEAAASLEAWHKRYPNAPIPADLLPLRKVTPTP